RGSRPAWGRCLRLSAASAGSSRRRAGGCMISMLMDRMLDQRLLVVAGVVALLLGGLYTFQHLNIEAYPDPSPPTIEVIAQNPGWSAEEMERQITVPIEIQLNGMPGLDHIRSISLFGLSDIKCYFNPCCHLLKSMGFCLTLTVKSPISPQE